MEEGDGKRQGGETDGHREREGGGQDRETRREEEGGERERESAKPEHRDNPKRLLILSHACYL